MSSNGVRVPATIASGRTGFRGIDAELLGNGPHPIVIRGEVHGNALCAQVEDTRKMEGIQSANRGRKRLKRSTHNRWRQFQKSEAQQQLLGGRAVLLFSARATLVST